MRQYKLFSPWKILQLETTALSSFSGVITKSFFYLIPVDPCSLGNANTQVLGSNSNSYFY